MVVRAVPDEGQLRTGALSRGIDAPVKTRGTARVTRIPVSADRDEQEQTILIAIHSDLGDRLHLTGRVALAPEFTART